MTLLLLSGQMLNAQVIIEIEDLIPRYASSKQGFVQNNAGIEISPNPATDYVRIRSNDGPLEFLEVKGLKGQTYLKEKQPKGQLSANLEPGYYWFIINVNGKLSNSLILINSDE